MTTPSLPLATRLVSAGAGVFMISVALLGLGVHLGGHPVPSHPYAETTLGILGCVSLLGALPTTSLGMTGNLLRVGASLLGAVSAVLWAISAFDLLTA